MAESNNKPIFDAEQPVGQAVLAWWMRLQGLKGAYPKALEAGLPLPGVVGERAELRRAESLADAVFTPAYQRLRLGLAKASADMEGRFSVKHKEPEIAALARVLVRIKAVETGKSFAWRMGEPAEEGGDKPQVSELRFKRLLRIDDPTGLTDALVRLLPRLELRADPLALARDIWFWNEKTRKRWADEYFQALLG